jgi:carbon monoxide dehydrogenase subunit G
MQRPRLLFLAAMIFCFAFTDNAHCLEKPIPFLKWTPPPGGKKPGIIEGLDKDTLIELTESGSVIYFHPRVEQGRFDVIVGQMIHAPLEEVWKVASDHEGVCKYMPNTFDECETISSQDNVVKMSYKIHTSVTKFSFNMKIIDQITENAPYGWKLETLEGDLSGRQLELKLIEVDENRTMVFLRYFGALRSMGVLVRLVLELVPDFETPVYSSAANYHLRCYKVEAERRSGYKFPDAPSVINFKGLDAKTIEKMCEWQGGLVRERPDGETINAMAFGAMNAPREDVWNVITDFENYDHIFPDSISVVEKRDGNKVVLQQKINQLSVYIFKFVFELRAHYTLEPYDKISYITLDGTYKDTFGQFNLVPYEEGQKTLVFMTLKAAIENDESLTMRIVRSGDFPFDTMANFFFARDTINKFGVEIDERGKAN